MSDAILVVNAGSSSLKFAIYANTGSLERIARGEVSGIGTKPEFNASCSGTASVDIALAETADGAIALTAILAWIDRRFPGLRVAAVGHRIVHGGTRHRLPVVLDAEILADLESLDPLAPQHQPFNLSAARLLRDRFPAALSVGCFDTAFHAGWSDANQRLALPRKFHDAGVRRYGFHGLSYEFLSSRMRMLAPAARRMVLAHLGSGASICATNAGRSIACTMGFSTVDGLPMATRSGALDPGVIFHLHRQYGLSLDDIEHLLYNESGLKGMSGISADMRALLASSRHEAKQAIDVFVQRCVEATGSMSASLGGLDALVFSGGIGAHAAAIRAAICDRLGCFGVVLDPARNAVDEERISADLSRVPVFALVTDEEGVIARHCREMLEAAQTRTTGVDGAGQAAAGAVIDAARNAAAS